MRHGSADIIRAGALWGYLQLTRFLAHDPAPLLAEAGLSEADLDNPDRYISRPAVVALLEISAKRLDCPDFGLRLGRMQDMYILGPLAFAMRNARDLRGALETMARHVNYQSPLSSIRMEPGDNANEERIVSYHEGDEPDATVQMVERGICLFCRVDDHLTGERVHAKRIMFAHAPASSRDVYAEYFSVAPEFNAPVTAVCMDRRDLALPVTTANPQLHAILERYLEFNAPAPGADITRRVREAIVQIMRNDNATIEDVAAVLKTHPRTLQRRLTAAGTTFERARDSVRKQMAEIYLANDVVPLAHVAHLVGYANQSVLTRSCLRWFGKTPLAMRQQVARGR
jgi:AraC-like DNA-binding protein